MKELSIIIPEHKEEEFVAPMLSQISILPYEKEVIIVSSKDEEALKKTYAPLTKTFNFETFIIPNIHNSGGARNVGGREAEGENLLFIDCHVCASPQNTQKLLNTLENNPDSVVGAAIQPNEFPSCEVSTQISSGVGYGVAFKFNNVPFEWTWLPAERQTAHEVPTICACAFATKQKTFQHFLQYGGFIEPDKGVGFEEEFGIRLSRLNHPILIEPNAIFGHLFKCYQNHPCWDKHSVSGYHEAKIASVYLDIFNHSLFNHIKNLCVQHWGEDLWNVNFNKAESKYKHIRRKLKPLKNRIDENWFFRID